MGLPVISAPTGNAHRIFPVGAISDQEIPETFTVVVWKEDTRKWPPAASFGAGFNKKMVCATGTIEEFDGSPAIVATEPSQLKIDC